MSDFTNTPRITMRGNGHKPKDPPESAPPTPATGVEAARERDERPSDAANVRALLKELEKRDAELKHENECLIQCGIARDAAERTVQAQAEEIERLQRKSVVDDTAFASANHFAVSAEMARDAACADNVRLRAALMENAELRAERGMSSVDQMREIDALQVEHARLRAALMDSHPHVVWLAVERECRRREAHCDHAEDGGAGRDQAYAEMAQWCATQRAALTPGEPT